MFSNLAKSIVDLFSMLQELLRPKCQNSGFEVRRNLNFKINFVSLEAPTSTNKVFMAKFIIEECFKRNI